MRGSVQRLGDDVAIPYEALLDFRSKHVFNPWAQRDPLDDISSGRPDDIGPRARLARLQAHFAIAPALVLVGEASGYQGCHFSGLAFTNEKLLLEQRIPRIGSVGRLTKRPRPWCEPSATVVWGALHALDLADRTVLWNAFAWHPFKPGQPYSNRPPTRAELEDGREVLDGVLDEFAAASLVAVGQVADRALRGLGRTPDATLRHPSMGGANEFRAGLRALAKRLTSERPSLRRRAARRRATSAG